MIEIGFIISRMVIVHVEITGESDKERQINRSI